MKQFYLLFSFLLILSSGMAQNIVSYAYDNAGNRISRKVVNLNSNPTRGALAVEITGGNDKDAIQLIVFSAQGVQLQNVKVTATTTPVNMSAYPGGWYILRVQAGEKVTEFKIIKQ